MKRILHRIVDVALTVLVVMGVAATIANAVIRGRLREKCAVLHGYLANGPEGYLCIQRKLEWVVPDSLWRGR